MKQDRIKPVFPMRSHVKKKGSSDMKKAILVVMMIGLVLMIAGCSGYQTGNNIKKWETQDKEAKSVLEMLTGGEYYSVADYTAGSKLKTIRFGYDYYKGGKLIKDCECGGVEKIANEKTEGLAGVCFRDGDYRAFCAEKEGGGGAVTGTLEGWKKTDARQLGFAGLEGEKAFAMNEKCYIAAYVSGDVLAEPDTMIKEKEIMKENDKCWLFYIIFNEKNQ